MDKPADRTILITGVSSGLGRALAIAALDAGHPVVGTARRTEDISAFEALRPGMASGVLLDMTDIAAFPAVIAAAEARSGPIDVLVNNAGFGVEGLFEETALDTVRRQFETNLFGPIALTQAVLAGMRVRRRGHIINITSVGGFRGVPALSAYCASKAALEVLSEALATEVEPFGIHVTAVAPGAFRTDFIGRSMQRAVRRIGDYDDFVAPIAASRNKRHGAQPGDPAKAGAAILALINAEKPPRHLVLGADGLAVVRGQLAKLERELADWEPLSRSTDIDG